MKKLVTLFFLGFMGAAFAGAVPAFGAPKVKQDMPTIVEDKEVARGADAFKVKQCMSNLPETIKLEGLKEPLIKTKPLMDHEATQEGTGYSQNYENAVCWVTVYLYDLTEKQITKAIIEADFLRNLQQIGYIFNKVQQIPLNQYNSYKVPLLGSQYLANVAFTGKTSEALMEGGFNNYILKGRATCRQLQGVKADVNANIALKHLKELLGASAAKLEPCLK